MAAHIKHKKEAEGLKPAKLALITVSSSRYEKKVKGESFVDESGSKAREMVAKTEHKVGYTSLVSDEEKMIRREVLKSIYEEDCDAVVVMGGTGLAKRDVTVESLRPMFEKEIEGFGEVFRAITYQKIGTPAYLSRVTAGTISRKPVFVLPGSPHATETGLELILSELSHIVYITEK